jgi:uncharacterized protein (DUF302 family)
MSKRIDAPYEEALRRTKAALADEGFGVLTEIDVQDTLRDRLGIEFRRYVIIGACNPPLAHAALERDLDIGLLLPCNVIVYEEGEGSVVAVFDPVQAMALAGSEALTPIAEEARARLERALTAL